LSHIILLSLYHTLLPAHFPGCGSLSGLLDLAEELVSRRETPTAFAEDPHGDGEQTDEDMQSPDDREDLKRALRHNPTRHKVIHTERIKVTKVERRKGLGSFVAVAFGDIGVNAVDFLLVRNASRPVSSGAGGERR
jgi:hypothetical protein